MAAKARHLGKSQRNLICAMNAHGGTWSETERWSPVGTPGQTQRVAESLASRGILGKRTLTIYHLNETSYGVVSEQEE